MSGKVAAISVLLEDFFFDGHFIAGDPALSFTKCCLREPRGRARSPGDDRKLH